VEILSGPMPSACTALALFSHKLFKWPNYLAFGPSQLRRLYVLCAGHEPTNIQESQSAFLEIEGKITFTLPRFARDFFLVSEIIFYIFIILETFLY